MRPTPWIVALLISIAPAFGGSVDLRDLPGNYFVGPWGQRDTTLYAQSVVADAPILATAAWCAETYPDDIPFNMLITGARPDAGGLGLAPNFADIRYSTAQVVPAWQQLEFAVSPGLPVLPGETLFLVFDVFSWPEAGFGGILATSYRGASDAYPAGEFVYLNTGELGAAALQALDTFSWQHRAADNQDLAVYVSFIPEPASATLLLAGLAMIGLRKR